MKAIQFTSILFGIAILLVATAPINHLGAQEGRAFSAEFLDDLIEDEPSVREAKNYIARLSERDRNRAANHIAGKIYPESNLTEPFARMLCALPPWTTGIPETDDAHQAGIWSVMRKKSKHYTRLFLYLDCAAANRRGFYYDEIVGSFKDLNKRYCEGDIDRGTVSEQNAALEKKLVRTDGAIERGLDGPGAQSYIPIRNSLRRAMLAAELGVLEFQNSPEDGNRLFLTAAKFLEKRNTKDYLTRARNGWRFHSDLSVLSAFYRALSGDQDALDLLESYADWKAVRDDDVIKDSVEPDVKENMPEGYVDTVFLERLLPGAASSSDDECKRWRRRNYSTRGFAKHAHGCLKIDSSTLTALDNCMAKYVATDWYIQFRSFKKGNGRESAEFAKDLIAKALMDIPGNLEDVSGALGVVEKGDYFVVRTESKFSTDQIEEFKKLIGDRFGVIVYGRPRQY